MSKSLAGVVVLYNPDKNVSKNIETYLGYIEKLYVVDNSKNANFENLIPKSKKIVYLPQRKNIGIAKALNTGAKNAVKDGYDFLLTMDQDSTFSEKSIKTLLTYLKTHDMSKIGILSPFQYLAYHTKSDIPKTETTEMDVIMTSGNIINLKAYQEVQGFKDWFFIDCVDHEFCYNLREHGYKIIQLNTSILDHNLGNISVEKFLWKKPKHSNHNYIRRYYIARNTRYLMDLYNYSHKKRWQEKILELKIIGTILFYEKDKFRKIRSIFRGERDYKHGIKGEYPYDN